MPTFSAEPLTAATARILEAAGTPAEASAKIATWLVRADLSGHPSHGVIRIPDYIDRIRQGAFIPAVGPVVASESDTTVLLDAQYGFGHLAAEDLTLRLAAKAKTSRVAIGGIFHCNHIGRLGEWAELGADLGVVYLMAAGGPGTMRAAPFGGAEGRLSTNPMAFGAPAEGTDPLIVDFATTATAEGKVRVALAKGTQLPPGQILDGDGQPSTNPGDLYDGGVLLHMAGHKGYGLSLMTEILAANLTGAINPEINVRIGTFAMAVDTNAFDRGDGYDPASRDTFDRMRNTRPAAGFDEVLIPGDTERRSRETLSTAGLPVAEATWTAILDTADSLGLDRDELDGLARGSKEMGA
ncbi:MAG: Ldh family oxidoreductase [Chloroflexi bacterium]|nr:Ldh family oxidoreductase [Chloroflexota bacterium]